MAGIAAAERGGIVDETTGTPLDQLRADYEAHPDESTAAARLAEHYADLGWYNEALDVYREALKRTPDEMSLLVGFGNTCFRHKDFREALATFKRLTELRPERIEGWNNLGIVHMAMGNDDGARAAFDRVLSIEPDNAGTLLNMGNCHARKGDTAGARAFFERAMAVKPDYADGWFNLGNTCLAEKDYEKAGLAFEKAIRYQREFPSALKNLGYVREQQGEWEKAAECYRAAAQIDRVDAGIQINLANACIALEQFEEARNCFLKAVRLAPKNTAGWMGLRHIALMKGDLPTYMRATSAILPHLSETAIATTIEIMLGLGHLQEAKEIALAADRCDKRSDDLDAQRMLAFKLCTIEPDRQRALYERLCGLPDVNRSDPVNRALAWYAFECDDFAAAKIHCRAIRKMDPKIQGILVRSHLALGEKKEVRELLERFIAENPENSEMLFLMARLELEEGDRDRAGGHFLLALENGFIDIDEIERYPALKSIFEGLGNKVTE
jgi:tetratricopeptide (TPR) repeat protein